MTDYATWQQHHAADLYDDDPRIIEPEPTDRERLLAQRKLATRLWLPQMS